MTLFNYNYFYRLTRAQLNNKYNIQRFPKSTDKSLRAWSAADEYILRLAEEEIYPTSKITIINDRFGYLSTHLYSNTPEIITHYKSQEDAILYNFELNKLDATEIAFSNLLADVTNHSDIILLKIPKSIDLFHLFIIKVHQQCKPDSKVFCGFMTRHFTKQMIEVASLYFEQVEQSLAWKKSRVMKLSSPRKVVEKTDPLHTILFDNHRGERLTFKQYYGVFSSKRIDYATQLLLENLEVDESVSKVLDLASGNGVIAHEVRAQSSTAEIHLMDDSYLAIASSKLNLQEGDNHFHYNYKLNNFEDAYFDLVVCNPPFHFEHENTIDIALNLFEEVSRILKSDGSFILVSNLHLNYKTHLSKIFSVVKVLNMNSKFEVICCEKIF